MKKPLRVNLLRYFPTITLLLLIIVIQSLMGQTPTVQDCVGAIPVCQDIYIQETTYLGSGNYPNEVYNPGGDCTLDCPGSCLDGEQNSVWYVFTVQQGGLLRLTIDPFFDADDYDWAVYDITELRCDNIYSHYPLMQKSCNSWGSTSFNGNTGISTSQGGSGNCNHCGDDTSTKKWNADLQVVAGRTYVLIMENWGTTPEGGYTLDFSASDAVIYDNVRPELDYVHGDEITCGTTEIVIQFSENVACVSVNPSDFILSGPGGPYNILDVQGEACMLGGQMEAVYKLFIDRPIREDGDYSLQIIAMNFIYDACNNFALGNTIVFPVSLGAPVINENGMTITTATCGLSNGSITGLQITGNPPFTYHWMNYQGQIIGNTLDLLNVPSGNYYFQVSDPNTCATASGPYFIDQTGMPGVDDAGMNITSATYGANNGSITGIIATGTLPLTFIWTDENNNNVGSSLDLINIYTGTYTLQIVDGNGCDTLAGPYFVPQIGGPVMVIAKANPVAICIGESSQLNALSSGGTGTYTFFWTSGPPGFYSTEPDPLVFPTGNTTYYITIDDGYVLAEDSVMVTVYMLPVSNAGIDQTIWYGTSTTLYGEVTGGTGNYSYAWEPENMLILPNVQNPPTKNLFQPTFFTLTATDNNTGCISLTDTILVFIQGGPLNVTASAANDSICEKEATSITAVGSGGNQNGPYTFRWYDQGGDMIFSQDAVYISTLNLPPTLAPGDYVYSVIIDDIFNDTTTSARISVLPKPFFEFNHPQVYFACPYDTVAIYPEQSFTNVYYYWSDGSVNDTLLVGTTGIGFDIKEYSLTITNDYNCYYSDTIQIIFDYAYCFGTKEQQVRPEILVYPNPTPGKFTIVFDDGEGYSKLEIINSQGQLIVTNDLEKMDAGFNELTLDLTGHPKGIYFLRAIHDRFIHHQKIILQ